MYSPNVWTKYPTRHLNGCPAVGPARLWRVLQSFGALHRPRNLRRSAIEKDSAHSIVSRWRIFICYFSTLRTQCTAGLCANPNTVYHAQKAGSVGEAPHFSFGSGLVLRRSGSTMFWMWIQIILGISLLSIPETSVWNSFNLFFWRDFVVLSSLETCRITYLDILLLHTTSFSFLGRVLIFLQAFKSA